MQISGRMVGVQVTAQQKFDEAAHFYNCMEGARTNVVVFPYYLSAFLSAFRSVTLYLQTQFAHDSRFKEWYEVKQCEMRDDPTMKILNESRRTVVHVAPFDRLFFRKGMKSFGKSNQDSVFTDFLEIHDGITDDGELKMSVRVGREGEEEAVTPWIAWHFSADDDLDVMQHCHSGLQKMTALLEEFTDLNVPPARPIPEAEPSDLT